MTRKTRTKRFWDLDIEGDVRVVAAILTIILLLGLGIRLWLYVGYNWYDDGNYIEYIEAFMRNGYNPNQIHVLYIRIMMIWPTVLMFKLFGVSEFNATLYPLICSLLSIILAYKLGALLFDKRSGLVAAALLAVYPNNVIVSTLIMPDTPIILFSTGAVYLFLKSEKEKKHKSLLMFLSGISIGLGYMAKVSGLIPIYFIGPYVLWKNLKTPSTLWKSRKNLTKPLIKIFHENKRYVLPAIGFLVIFLAEGTFFYTFNGDFFLRSKQIDQWYANLPPYLSSLDYYPETMFNLNRNPWHVKYGLLYYAFVLSLIFGLIKKDKKMFIPAMWVLIYFSYQQFGSQSISEFKPIVKEYRYLSVLTIPMLICVSRLITQLKQKKVATLILAILLISSIYYAERQAYYRNGEMQDLRLIHEYLKDKEFEQIWAVGDGTLSRIDLLRGFDSHSKWRFLGGKTCKEIDSGIVLTQSTRAWHRGPAYMKNVHSCYFNPPKKWVKLIEIESGFEEYPYNQFNPVIYQVNP